MAYNVNALTEYINEQKFPILQASVKGARTAQLFGLQTGIKFKDVLNIMDTQVIFQDDSEGASTAGGGNTTFTQRFIEVAPICVREFYDPKKLNKFYLQSQLNAGSKDDALPFEGEIVKSITDKISQDMEIAYWKGNKSLTGTSNSNVNKFDGFIKIIDAEATVVRVTGATLSAANIIAQIDAVVNAIPTKVLRADDMAILVGEDTYRTYVLALKNANMFHYAQDGGDSFKVPGTQITIYAVPGLDGTGRAYAMRLSNGKLGTDLEGEEDDAEAVYLPYEEKVKVKIAWKSGVQIAFPEEIVTYKAN